MSWCLVSAATGPHLELLEISKPALRAYARRHGYDTHFDTTSMAGDLPASWYKVPLISRLLNRHDGVLWVDADATFIDVDTDVRDVIKGDWNWVVHRLPEGDIPNCGVLALRNKPKVHAFLRAIWDLRTVYAQHPWWEQAAAMDLTGTHPGLPPMVAPKWEGTSEFSALPRELPRGWNHLPDRSRDNPDVVILHASGPGIAWQHKVQFLQSAVRVVEGCDTSA